MKITYISHATLLIETDDVKIVTDPWVKGATYCNQWYQFPKCLSPGLIKDADCVIYSHGHEDHLHGNSLQTVNKDAMVFYPYSWYGGTTEFFNELGFDNVKEVVTDHTVTFKNAKITYLSNNLDNVVVIELDGKVIVNVNDALPSASAAMIDHFIKKINQRWKKIDYVFSSYGGAAYFPNTVHYALKNDVEIAETRELFFVTNFCKIIAGLNPIYAIPFATDFILLDDNQRWINDTKFLRSNIKQFYADFTNNSTSVQVIEAYPNDYFSEGTFHKVSPYHQKNAEQPMLSTIDEDYKEEIAQKRALKKISAAELDNLLEKTKAHILHKNYIIPEAVRKHIKFSLKIVDGEKENILTVDFRKSQIKFTVSSSPAEGIDLLMEIKSKTLHYALDNEWGGDAIIIGYGTEIYIYNEECITRDYENYCVRLLSRYPNTKEYLKKSPFRALKYLLSDDVKRNNLLQKALGNPGKIIDYSDNNLGKRDLWLSKDKCEVCKACNI